MSSNDKLDMMYNFVQSKLKTITSTLDLLPYINNLMTFNNLKLQLSMALHQVYLDSKQQGEDQTNSKSKSKSKSRRNGYNKNLNTNHNIRNSPNSNYNTIQSLFFQLQRFSDVKNDISLNNNTNPISNTLKKSQRKITINKTPSLIPRQQSIFKLNNNKNHNQSLIPSQTQLSHPHAQNHQKNQNLMVQDIIIDETCKNSINCVALKRIIEVLRYYDNITSSEEDSINEGDERKDEQRNKHKNSTLWITYFNDTNYKHLLNDYHHILKHHLHKKDISKSNDEFDIIYKQIIKYVKHCDVTKCQKFRRNRRIREHENISILNCRNNDLCNFYTETLDSIHCYFLHSFDIGMRVKAKEYLSTKDNDDIKVNKQNQHSVNGHGHSKKQRKIKVDDNEFYTDKKLAKLKQVLNHRLLPLKRGYVIKGGQNKYFSNMNDEPEHITLPRTLAPLCKNVFNDHKQRKFEV